MVCGKPAVTLAGGTVLGQICRRRDSVRPWDSPSADEKTLFSRMAEVYAAFSEYTDVQIGRVIDYLEESGQLPGSWPRVRSSPKSS